MRVDLTGRNYEPRLDASTLAQEVIDYAHHEVHGGSSYIVTDWASVDADGTRAFLITTPDTAKWAHMVFVVEGTLVTEVELYENPTNVTGGSAMVEYNRNRNSSNTAGVAVTHTPTVTDAGSTVLFKQKFGLALGGGAAATTFGGSTRAAQEFLLKQNEQYLLLVTSRTDANIISTVLSWYEHQDKVTA